MVSVEKAILVEVFGLLLVAVGVAVAASGPGVFGDWDVFWRPAFWILAGLAVGVTGLAAGLRT